MAEKKADKKTEKKKPIVKKRKSDKWKKKIWYTILASKEFANKEIGTTVAEKPENLVGRKIGISVRNLAGQARKHHITIIFKIDEVKGNKAYANAVGHKIPDSYMKKFVRSRSSKIQITLLLNLPDGKKLRVSTVCLTSRKIERKKKTAIRKIMEEKINRLAKIQSFQKIISELIFGNVPQDILSSARKVAQIKRIEITKSQLILSK